MLRSRPDYARDWDVNKKNLDNLPGPSRTRGDLNLDWRRGEHGVIALSVRSRFNVLPTPVDDHSERIRIFLIVDKNRLQHGEKALLLQIE
jgi:hypothetical protein